MKRVCLKYGPNDAGEAERLRPSLIAHGLKVAKRDQSRDGDIRGPRRYAAPEDYVVIVVSPELVASEAAMQEVQEVIGSQEFAGRILAVMIRPTVVLPWCFRKLPMFTLWDDRTAGIEHLVQAIKSSGRQRAAG